METEEEIQFINQFRKNNSQIVKHVAVLNQIKKILVCKLV